MTASNSASTTPQSQLTLRPALASSASSARAACSSLLCCSLYCRVRVGAAGRPSLEEGLLSTLLHAKEQRGQQIFAPLPSSSFKAASAVPSLFGSTAGPGAGPAAGFALSESLTQVGCRIGLEARTPSTCCFMQGVLCLRRRLTMQGASTRGGCVASSLTRLSARLAPSLAHDFAHTRRLSASQRWSVSASVEFLARLQGLGAPSLLGATASSCCCCPGCWREVPLAVLFVEPSESRRKRRLQESVQSGSGK